MKFLEYKNDNYYEKILIWKFFIPLLTYLSIIYGYASMTPRYALIDHSYKTKVALIKLYTYLFIEYITLNF